MSAHSRFTAVLGGMKWLQAMAILLVLAPVGTMAQSGGAPWAWGRNKYGQLGNGRNTDSNVPILVPGITDATAIAGGAGHSLAVGSYTPVAPLVVSSLVKMDDPFRIVVKGTNFQNGIKVFINGSGTVWGQVAWKNTTKVVIKGGYSLKVYVPQGRPTDFTFVNADGGIATVTGWSW